MARRRNARPPWMRSLPCHLPDCRDIGARPARLAACFPSSVPNSGISMSIENAVVFAMPGMLIKIASLFDSALSSATFGDINLPNLDLDLLEARVNLISEQGLPGCLQPGLCRHLILHQGPARSHQFSKYMEDFALRLIGFEAQN